MNSPKEKKWPKRIGIFIIFVFLCLYAISQSGYITKINLDKTLYTEEEIRDFENKILNGEEINIDDYFKEKEVDYDNYFTILGIKISNSIYYIANKLFNYFNKFLSYLF